MECRVPFADQRLTNKANRKFKGDRKGKEMRTNEPLKEGQQPEPNIPNRYAVKAGDTSETVSADMQPHQLANVSAGLAFVDFSYQFEFTDYTLAAVRNTGVNPDGYPGEEWIWESDSYGSDN
jgi:hypothetical protein